jgi:hypothetical protein
MDTPLEVALAAVALVVVGLPSIGWVLVLQGARIDRLVALVSTLNREVGELKVTIESTHLTPTGQPQQPVAPKPESKA